MQFLYFLLFTWFLVSVKGECEPFQLCDRPLAGNDTFCKMFCEDEPESMVDELLYVDPLNAANVGGGDFAAGLNYFFYINNACFADATEECREAYKLVTCMVQFGFCRYSTDNNPVLPCRSLCHDFENKCPSSCPAAVKVNCTTLPDTNCWSAAPFSIPSLLLLVLIMSIYFVFI